MRPRTPRTAALILLASGLVLADGLGPEDSPGGTYLGAARHHTDTIVKAPGGRV